jgi:hypothetical protein
MFRVPHQFTVNLALTADELVEHHRHLIRLAPVFFVLAELQPASAQGTAGPEGK